MFASHTKHTWHAYGFLLLGMLISLFIFYSPNYLGDAENFIPANPLVTPVHIMPEWYFLFAYTILRTIPNKLGGVLMLVFSIVVLLVMAFIHKIYLKSNMFKIVSQIWF